MPRPDDRGGPPQDPALVLAKLRNSRAQLAASIPTDEEFEAVQNSQAELAQAQRTAAQERLAAFDQAISQLEAS